MLFYIMVGISGSGKSTVANNLIKDMEKESNKPSVLLSTDAIREELTGDYSNQDCNNEVFNLFYQRIRENTKVKNNIIVDATNLSVKYRKVIFSNINNRQEYDVIAYIMPTDINTCYTQNEFRPKPVPKDVIYRQVHNFEIPFFEEGFNHIYIHNINYFTHSLGFKTNEFYALSVPYELIKPMEGFDQRTHWHKYDLFTHSLIVANGISLMYELQPDDKDYTLIKAALLHDYGKLFTATPKKDLSGEYTYYNHANVGTYLLLRYLDRLNFDNYEDALNFLFYINYHMFPFDWSNEDVKEKYRKLFGDVKYNKLMMLHFMDDKMANEKGEHFKGFNDFRFYNIGE